MAGFSRVKPQKVRRLSRRELAVQDTISVAACPEGVTPAFVVFSQFNGHRIISAAVELRDRLLAPSWEKPY